MPGGARKKKSSRKGRQANRRTNVSESTLVYRGPYSLPRVGQQAHTDVVELTAVTAMNSDSGGGMDLVINNDPSGYTDWSSYAALWDEYRPLAMKLTFIPNNQYSKTTTICVPLYVVIDRDSAGALSSKNQAIQYESCKIKSLENRWTYGAKMHGPTGAGWITTAATSPTWWIKSFAVGLTGSTGYGDSIVVLLIQVRGKN
jgi:hypothetical protein